MSMSQRTFSIDEKYFSQKVLHSISSSKFDSNKVNLLEGLYSIKSAASKTRTKNVLMAVLMGVVQWVNETFALKILFLYHYWKVSTVMANETYVLLKYLHCQAYYAPPMGLAGRQFLEGGGW